MSLMLMCFGLSYIYISMYVHVNVFRIAKMY